MSDIILAFLPNGKIGTLSAAFGPDVLLVDTCDITRETARAKFAAKLHEKCPTVLLESIESQLLSLAAREVARRHKLAEADGAATKPPAAEAEISAEDREAGLALLRNPALIREVVDDVGRLGVAGESKLRATVYVVGVSRLLPRPLAAIVQGLTSSGKSYVIEQASLLFPPEAVLRASAMTSQALYHLPAGALEHRFIVAGERSRRQDDETADATKALREMLSSGKLSKLIPMRQADGRIETELVEQNGPIAYIESTTVQNVLDEDRNRCVVLATDESPQQTRRIIDALAACKAGDFIGNAEAVMRRHHAAQRLLRKCRVVIPFAARLAELFPNQRADFRRTFGQLLSFIEAVALLHQYQRTTEPADGATIEATEHDYMIARDLLAEPFARTLKGGLSAAAEHFRDRLREWFIGGETFTTADVASREKIIGDVTTVRDYVRALARVGAIVVVQAAKGRKPGVYKLGPIRDDADVAGLPSVEQVFSDSAPRHRVNDSGA